MADPSSGSRLERFVRARWTRRDRGIRRLAERAALVPFYPLAVATAIILGFYSSTHVSVDELWRPLIISALASGLLVIVAGGLTGRWHGAAFAVTLVIAALFGLWLLLAFLAALRLVIAARSMWLRRRLGTTAILTYPLNVLSGAWLLVATVSGFLAASASPELVAPPPLAVSAEATPNIYVILLDGYPRADTLADYFGYDNGSFLAALEQRGFHVSEHSHSDYNVTLQTVPSMLHMQSAESLGLVPLTGDQTQHRRVGALINASPVIATLRQVDYHIVSVVPTAAALNMHDADVVWEDSLLSPFEDSLLDEGIFDLVSTDLRYEDRRRAVRGAFDALSHVAINGASPQFVYAHIMSPHAPFAFTADGGAARPVPCEPSCDIGTTFLQDGWLSMTLDELSGRFTGQLEYVNARVIETADAIQTADPEAVIVFLSDHGSRLDLSDPDEWYRNFFAAYTPGRPALFGDNPTPTDLFRVLFSAYFGADL